jgi:hypothetical protein
LVAFLLDAGAPINAINDFGITALMLAEDRDHYDLAEWLVLHGADPTIRAADGFTVLSEAWKKDRWDFVRFLLLHGADPQAPIEYYAGKGPPLVAAAWEGQYKIVELLLQQGVDVNAKDSIGMSALRTAAGKGDLEIVRLLLEHGADVNSRASSDTTPLHAAVSGQHIDIVRVLIENGADVNTHSTSDEEAWRTPLTLARYKANKLRRSDDPIVALLLEHGAEMPDQLSTPEAIHPAACVSEKSIEEMNWFLASDRLARYVGNDARLFVEIVSFWELGETEPAQDSLLADTAVVWSLKRVNHVDLAPLVLFKDGCALPEDMGLIFLDRINAYKRIFNLIKRKPDRAVLRAALLELANQLWTEESGVFSSPLEVEPEVLVSEFEKRLKNLPSN